ncbi:MAG TPA: glutaredoxin 3 [Myxococcaceae bacterium]|jgi:glutaredoxin 3
MSLVKIYTKSTCPYSKRAKQLLDTKGVPYEEIVIDVDTSKREEMIAAASGRATVPQVFIAGRHIGGSDDLQELESSGELDGLLGRSGSQPGA